MKGPFVLTHVPDYAWTVSKKYKIHINSLHVHAPPSSHPAATRIMRLGRTARSSLRAIDVILASPRGNTPASAVTTQRGAPATPASVLQCDHDERKGGVMPNAIKCEGVPPLNRLHHTLPSWPVGRWEHGIPGHRRTLSAWQRGRSGGAAMGVGLQKERRGSAAD